MVLKAHSAELIKSMAQRIDFVSFDIVETPRMSLQSHWYRYENMDLYYFQDSKGKIVKIHISIFGQVIEWNVYDGIQTGLLVEEEQLDNDVMQIVQFDSSPNINAVEQGLLIIENALNIKEKIRIELKKMILVQPKSSKGLIHKIRNLFKPVRGVKK